MSPRKQLVLRLASAFTAIPIVLALLWLGGGIMVTGAIAIFAWALHEFVTVMRHRAVRILWPLCFVVGLLLILMPLLQGRKDVLVGAVAVCALLVLLWCAGTRRSVAHASIDAIATLSFPLYVGGAFACLISLRGLTPIYVSATGGLSLPAGVWWVITALAGTWVFDSGAYFVGRSFGRHKMAPVISPKKSWEGLGGGFIAVVPATFLLTHPLHLPGPASFGLSLIITVAAVLGDLGESWLKRWTRVKDSGRLMPGHGGLLDRIDSVTLVAFAVYLAHVLLIH